MTTTLLRVGDRFRLRLKEGKTLVGKVVFGTDLPSVDFDRLTVGTLGAKVSPCWTERALGGWERRREMVLDVACDAALLGATWKVEKTSVGGGGTGHGPYDVFPDGDFVVAHNLDHPNQKLTFFQTGCFNCMATPGEVEILPTEES